MIPHLRSAPKSIAAAALMSCAALASCGAPPLVGKWQGDRRSDILMDFRDDGTMTLRAEGETWDRKWSVDGDKLHIVEPYGQRNCVFSVSGDKLTLGDCDFRGTYSKR